ncbi:MAG: polysaccharide deacetylase family protein [Clostridia bacterium]|nr:polysaccharide deacetylase family protein [Clostridia bacterium]
MFVLITRRGWRRCLVGLCALVVGVGGLALSRHSGSVAAGNWGLSFPAEGQPPVGNATAEMLARYNAHYLGDTAQKRIYLTFDAGYENGYTPAILDTLKKQGVPACFFVVGHYLESAPELIKRMVAEGHIVGNHTHSHPDMAAIGQREAFLKELTAVEQAYSDLTGQKMLPIYRPPRGVYSEQNLQMAAKAGYHTVFWSLAYVDWYVDNQPTREQALEKLVGRIHPGAVVLLHSTSATNAAVLEEVIEKWKEMGYTFGTVTELWAA